MNQTIQLNEVRGFDATRFDVVVLDGAKQNYALRVYVGLLKDQIPGNKTDLSTLTITVPDSHDPGVQKEVLEALKPSLGEIGWQI